MFGERHPTNPRLGLDDNAFEMVRLWRLYQGGMVSGWAPGWLPDPGGVLDQAAVLLDAFAVMSAAEAALQPKGK